jgi:hypothetical protein
MFRSSKTYVLLLIFYLFFKSFKVSCSFINLNKYIDIFPPTYFVRLHADKLLFENLGPSNVPLTILAYNYNNPRDAWNSSIPWCKFFPGWRRFIGSRTKNTLNLIFQNITKCFTRGSKNRRPSSSNTCLFMNLVHGNIKDDRRLHRSCEVSGDRMHTLVIANRWEYNLFLKHPVSEEFVC